MDTLVLLCDYAEAINGKLYIMGGGWTVCPPGPHMMAVVVRVNVPWAETNAKHKLAVFLQDDNGNQVAFGEPPKPVIQTGDFEVGRPPGVPTGSDIAFTHVFGFVGLPLEPDTAYRWQLEIDDDPCGHASFRTLP